MVISGVLIMGRKITTKEAAAILGVSTRSVRNLVEKGTITPIPAYKENKKPTLGRPGNLFDEDEIKKIKQENAKFLKKPTTNDTLLTAVQVGELVGCTEFMISYYVKKELIKPVGVTRRVNGRPGRVYAKKDALALKKLLKELKKKKG
jgi:DNA-binding transcriptional MerR regulator